MLTTPLGHRHRPRINRTPITRSPTPTSAESVVKGAFLDAPQTWPDQNRNTAGLLLRNERTRRRSAWDRRRRHSFGHRLVRATEKGQQATTRGRKLTLRLWILLYYASMATGLVPVKIHAGSFRPRSCLVAYVVAAISFLLQSSPVVMYATSVNEMSSFSAITFLILYLSPAPVLLSHARRRVALCELLECMRLYCCYYPLSPVGWWLALAVTMLAVMLPIVLFAGYVAYATIVIDLDNFLLAKPLILVLSSYNVLLEGILYAILTCSTMLLAMLVADLQSECVDLASRRAIQAGHSRIEDSEASRWHGIRGRRQLLCDMSLMTTALLGWGLLHMVLMNSFRVAWCYSEALILAVQPGARSEQVVMDVALGTARWMYFILLSVVLAWRNTEFMRLRNETQRFLISFNHPHSMARHPAKLLLTDIDQQNDCCNVFGLFVLDANMVMLMLNSVAVSIAALFQLDVGAVRVTD